VHQTYSALSLSICYFLKALAFLSSFLSLAFCFNFSKVLSFHGLYQYEQVKKNEKIE